MISSGLPQKPCYKRSESCNGKCTNNIYIDEMVEIRSNHVKLRMIRQFFDISETCYDGSIKSPTMVHRVSGTKLLFHSGSLDKGDGSLEGGYECLQNKHDQQERSLGVTIITISILFIICQSVKMIPQFNEIFFCKPIMQFPSDQKQPPICESTPLMDKFIR